MMRPRIGASYALLLVIGIASRAAADEPVPPVRYPLAIAMSVEINERSRREEQFFYDSATGSAAALGVGYDAARYAEGFVLAPELGWTTESSERSLGQRGRARLDSMSFLVGLQARYELAEFFAPFLHVQLGATVARASLQDSATAMSFAGDGWAFTTTLGAGLTIRTPARFVGNVMPISLGLQFEGGVVLGSDLSLGVQRPPLAADAVPTSTISLGSFNRSGAYYFRIGLVVRI